MKRLLHITDCHLFADPDRTGYGDIKPYHSLARILSRVFNLCENEPQTEAYDGSAQPTTYAPGHIDGVIVTGDISGDDSKQSYLHFRQLIARYVSVPLWVIPGNHDNNPYFSQLLGDLWLQAGTRQVFGQWCLHGLDTRTTGTQGIIDNDQLLSVSNAIAQQESRHHLLCIHHHVYPTGSWMDTHNLRNPERLINWLKHQREVKALIHGHVHTPLRQFVDATKIPIFGAPSTSWQWQMSVDFSVSTLSPGYQILTLHPTGNLSVEIERI